MRRNPSSAGLGYRLASWHARAPRDTLERTGARQAGEMAPDGSTERTVSRVHDVGGQTGFGPVTPDDEGGPFHADWEARVWALNAVLRQRGLYSADEFRDAVERIPPADYLAASYYERWLRGMETLLDERGIA